MALPVIKNFLDEYISEALANTVCSNLSETMALMVEHSDSWSGDFGMQPNSYNSSMWSVIEAITESTIMPIAAMILTAVMCIELIGWINHQNNMHSSGEVVTQFFRFIIRLFIGVLLVQKSHDITLGIFQLSNYAVTRTSGVLSTDVAYNVLSSGQIAAMKEQLIAAGIGPLIGMLIVSFLGLVGAFCILAICRVIIIGRVIQIYMYCSIGSIPYATFMNRELSGIGQNYVKNLFAIAFQGFFMLVAITIYSYMVASMNISSFAAASFKGMALMILEFICYGFALVITLFGSKGLAKSIFNAH